MSWMNADGLHVKFGTEEAAAIRGGEFGTPHLGMHVIDFIIDWKDALSATASILGSVATVANPLTGSAGVLLPEGFIPEVLLIRAVEAFTSSGTIGSSTLVIGGIKASDRSTAYDVDGLTTTSFVLGVLDATSEGPATTNEIKVGATGAGDDFGVAYTEAAYVCVANSAHASHPLTAGVAHCRLMGRYGLSV